MSPNLFVGKEGWPPFDQYVRAYLVAADDFMDGVCRGFDDIRNRRIRPWAQIKNELQSTQGQEGCEGCQGLDV